MKRPPRRFEVEVIGTPALAGLDLLAEYLRGRLDARSEERV